jgi:hypothetical protein
MDGIKMTIPLPPYVAPYKPVPQVTPFTYRDGITMLKKLELLQRYINKSLVPFVNDNMEELGDAFETQVNALIEAVNAAIQLVIDDSIEVQDPVVAALVADEESDTNAALTTLINSFLGDYATPEDIAALVAQIAVLSGDLDVVEEIIDEGRLSPVSIEAQIGKGVNILDFGAVGDGVTDDTEAIQAAIDDASARFDRPTVFVPSDGRTYIISDTLTISKSFFTFGSDARANSQFKPRIKGSFIGPLMSFTAQGLTLAGIVLEGDYVQTGTLGTYDGLVTYGIVLDRTGADDPAADIDSSIVGCMFRSLKRSVKVVGRNLDIIDTAFTISGKGVEIGVYGTGVGLDECRGFRFLHNRFHTVGWGMGAILNGVDYSVGIDAPVGCYGTQITDNYVDGGSAGLYRGPIDRTMIDNNHMYNMMDTGITLIGGGTGWQIVGNTYAGLFNGAVYLAGAQRTHDSFVYMAPGGTLVDGIIANNTIINTRKHAISLATASSVVIAGNHIRDANCYWAQGDTHIYDGINITAGNNVAITGNVIRSSSIGGEVTHRYGINIAASSNAFIVGNVIQSAYTAPYYVQAPSSVVNEWDGVGATVAALTSLTNNINKPEFGKRTGGRVYCTNHSGGARPHWSTGDLAASTWINADGTTAHTPV